ncbi:MAG: hypothetical protein M3P39_01410, partial [Actinomycetota bacterium]|nr:hypothetical protein [Actinomycetota bacterium]
GGDRPVPSRATPPTLTSQVTVVRRQRALKVAVPGLAFVVALVVFSLLSRPSSSAFPPPAAQVNARAPAGRSTDAQIRALQAAVRAAPEEAQRYALLGEAYLQRARETGDPAFYDRAEGVLVAGRERDPRSFDVRIGLGAVALARHDFRGALAHGRAARRLAPKLVRPYPVVFDAQLELGRYAAARRTLQVMIDLKPSLASYSRVSYFRQLHGDLRGAVEAMRLAVSAGGGRPENLAYVQTLLGDLEFERGRLGAADRAYRSAVASFPGHLPARAGLARLAAARGRLGVAIRSYRRLVARLPLPEHVIALAEAELAAGRRAQAREHLALVRAQQRLLAARGVRVDVDLAVFEADHGEARRAVRLARGAWSAAPSVRSADALGWALTRAGRPRQGLAWSRRALALGTQDPLFLLHAGLAARGDGQPRLARRLLGQALARNPRFSPWHAPVARRALRGLS